MIIVSYMMKCDSCTNLLPGIDENWLSCKFSNEDVMYNHARHLGWTVWEAWDSSHIDFAPTGSVKCRTCKEGS